MFQVFVYGTLKRGYHNYDHFLANARFISEFKTAPNFLLYAPGSLPRLTPVKPGEGIAVRGEIFEIDQITLTQLDILEGVPWAYQRTLIPIQDYPNKVFAYTSNPPKGTNYQPIGDTWPTKPAPRKRRQKERVPA